MRLRKEHRESFISARKTQRIMDTRGDVEDVRVGPGDWQDSLIRQNAERDLGRQWQKMPR